MATFVGFQIAVYAYVCAAYFYIHFVTIVSYKSLFPNTVRQTLAIT